jgi:hypothetical protein
MVTKGCRISRQHKIRHASQTRASEKFAGQMKTARKVFGKLFSAVEIHDAFTNTEPTREETLSEMTFQIATIAGYGEESSQNETVSSPQSHP